MGISPAAMGLISSGIGAASQFLAPTPQAPTQLTQPAQQQVNPQLLAQQQAAQQMMQQPQQQFNLGTTSGQLPPEIMQLLLQAIGGGGVNNG